MLVCSWAGIVFFKQKTGYEMLRSLVGSEMCKRGRVVPVKVGLLKGVTGSDID